MDEDVLSARSQQTGLGERIRRSLFAWSAIALLTVGLAVTGVALIPMYHHVESLLEQEIFAVMAGKTAMVEDFIQENREIALQFGARTSLRRTLKNMADGGNPAGNARHLLTESLMDAVSHEKGVDGAVVVSPEGRVLAHVGRIIPPTLFSGRQADAINADVEIRPIRSHGDAFLILRTPILDRQDRHVGDLVLINSFRRLRERLARRHDEGRAGQTFLGHLSDGTVFPLVETDESGGLALPSPQAWLPLLRKGAAGEQSIVRFDLLGGQLDVTAFTPIRGTDWVLCYRKSEADLMKDLRTTTERVLWTVAGVVAVAMLFLFLLARPLSGRLVLAAQDLEREIRERTEELARRNEQLAAYARQSHEQMEHLEQLNSELEAFTRAAAHDLRAPLNNMRMAAQLLASERSQGDDYDTAKALVRNIDRMNDLIVSLMDFARAGREALKPQTVNVSKEAAAIFDELREVDSTREVDIRIEEDIVVHADPHLLGVALRNLLQNAWKYTRDADNARIEVKRANEEGWFGFEVCDNGAGFDMMHVERLFQPFERLHGGEFEGTGIGLSTVKRIIDRHGGHIEAQGESGKGATFRIFLPPVDFNAEESAADEEEGTV